MYRLILTPEDMAPYMGEIIKRPVMAVDVETTGLNPHAHRLRLVQIACEGLPTLIVDCFSFLPRGRDQLCQILTGKSVKVFHNAKFDLGFLLTLNIRPTPVFDTMLAAMLLRTRGGPGRFSLQALAAHYLDIDLNKSHQTGPWEGPLSPDQLEYAAQDAEILLGLREKLVPEIYKNQLVEIAAIEFGCAEALAHIEYAGIHIDRARWLRLTEKTESALTDALAALYQFTDPPIRQTTLWGDDLVYGANFDSGPFVAALLKKHGIIVEGTSKGELYAYRDHKLVKALLDYRKAAKSLSTFLHPIGNTTGFEAGRLHPKYHQISAGSGRMSCDGPNIQQIPRDPAFRACFSAEEGNRLVIADYSQIELRVAAAISGDERMKSAYREGRDLHLLTASGIMGIPPNAVTKSTRQAAKAVNFGLIFGMGAKGLMQYAGQSYGTDMTLQEATRFRNGFFRMYDGIERWHGELKKHPPREGRTLAGRIFSYGENAPIPVTANFPVQGTAADIIKKALASLVRCIPADFRIVAVVHDEIILECPEARAAEAAKWLKSAMEDAGNSILKTVPVVAEAEIAEDWSGK